MWRRPVDGGQPATVVIRFVVMDKRLQAAVRLREAGDAERARVALLGLVAERPGDAVVHYQTACAHDALGLEAQAVPFYERALELGLEGPDRAGALVGLGSSYRNLGRYDDAERTLRAGREEFGHGGAFDAFLAMVLHNLGRHAEAIELLLTALASTSADDSIRRYRRAIEFYADELAEP
jgi:tetratricopeptide (TPR) repeat protein